MADLKTTVFFGSIFFQNFQKIIYFPGSIFFPSDLFLLRARRAKHGRSKLVGDAHRPFAQLFALQPIVCAGLPASPHPAVLSATGVQTGEPRRQPAPVAGAASPAGLVAWAGERAAGAGMARGASWLLETLEAEAGGCATRDDQNSANSCGETG
jgi:hypothetical protein